MFGSGLAWPGFGLSRGFLTEFGPQPNQALSATMVAPEDLIGKSKSHGFLARLWPERYPSRAKSMESRSTTLFSDVRLPLPCDGIMIGGCKPPGTARTGFYLSQPGIRSASSAKWGEKCEGTDLA
ncbi:hypothetical protein DFH06DRAFT_1130899 [Mycena polygramma]|nr:hypothetical protein DFH06DRAFT_1130899 [Mycena polygramma]